MPKCKWNENFKQISKTNIVTSREGLHLNQKDKKKKSKEKVHTQRELGGKKKEEEERRK